MDMPVVGRGRVLDELARLASEAMAGGGALVLVSGEARIGKTTILSCLARLAGAAGIPVLAGRGAAAAPRLWRATRFASAGRRGYPGPGAARRDVRAADDPDPGISAVDGGRHRRLCAFLRRCAGGPAVVGVRA